MLQYIISEQLEQQILSILRRGDWARGICSGKHVDQIFGWWLGLSSHTVKKRPDIDPTVNRIMQQALRARQQQQPELAKDSRLARWDFDQVPCNVTRCAAA